MVDTEAVRKKYAITVDEIHELAKMTGDDDLVADMFENDEEIAGIADGDDGDAQTQEAAAIENRLNEFVSREDLPTDPQNLIEDMTTMLLETDPKTFLAWVEDNRKDIFACAAEDAQVADALVLCYRFGIALGSGEAANDLGALYYMGEIVEQDYAKAAELYELAVDMGCDQSIINLGYIYEYGRLGTPDYAKAFEYYSLAAALDDSFEAIYKLGDMYERGEGVEQNKKTAFKLWEKSLETAERIIEIAQPAFRIASLIIDPACEKLGIKFDPLQALFLFQQAEVGLRADIANGQTYYENRLAEAIEGQQRARELLDSPVLVEASKATAV